MKAFGIRKLRVDAGWRQFTEPELSSLLPPSATFCYLVQPIAGRKKTSTAPSLKLEMRASAINRSPWLHRHQP
jgi:hypothetical protein